MKRREFIKLATAVVPVAFLPAVVLASGRAIDPADIKWWIEADPSIGYATRIMAEHDNRVASILCMHDEETTDQDIEQAKKICLKMLFA